MNISKNIKEIKKDYQEIVNKKLLYNSLSKIMNMVFENLRQDNDSIFVEDIDILKNEEIHKFENLYPEIKKELELRGFEVDKSDNRNEFYIHVKG